MKAIVMRDKTLDWFELIFYGHNMKVACWVLVAASIVYFGWGILR
jgi:hypothetical protein